MSLCEFHSDVFLILGRLPVKCITFGGKSVIIVKYQTNGMHYLNNIPN